MKNRLAVLLTIAFVWGAGLNAEAYYLADDNPVQIDIINDSGFISGEVREGHDIYEFEAWEEGLLTLGLEVTAILPDNDYVDDDTQLYLFDSLGTLLASNDDALGSSYESLIDDFWVQEGDMFYVGVTTFDNPPLLGADNIITGWNDIGGSHVRYDLNVDISTVPEPSAWVLLGVGMTGLALFRKKHGLPARINKFNQDSAG